MAQSHGLGVRDVSRITAVILSVLLMCVAGGGSSARAQGTSGFFADPIRLVELTDLLESNGVVYRAVYPTIEAAHVKYLAECAELRKEKIEAVQKVIRGLLGSVEEAKDATQVQRMSDGCRVIIARNLELELALFDGVRDALPQEAHAGVARARATRERTQLQSFAGADWGMGERVVDVPVLMRALQWKEVADATAVRAECEIALGDYDLRQTKFYKSELAKALVIPVEMAKLMASTPAVAAGDQEQDAGLQTMPPNDALVKVLGPFIEAHVAARASSERAFRAVLAVLTARNAQLARAFRKQFIAQVYPEISQVPTDDFETQATNALRLKRLTGDQRAAIRSIYQQWQVQDDRLIDAHIVLQERLVVWMATNIGAFDQGFYEKLSADQAAIEEKQAKCAETALRAIGSVAGVEIQTLLDKIGTHEEADLFLPSEQVNLAEAIAGPLDIVASDDSAHSEKAIAGHALWFDTRMDDAWMDRISGAIEAEAGPRATLESLKADYWRAWDARIAPMVATMARPFVVEKPDEDVTIGSVNFISEEGDVATWVANAAANRREMHELEDQFFADVQSVVALPSQAAVIELLRAGRRCGERVDALDVLFDGIEGGEENANVILAATGVQLSAADCAKVALVLGPKLAGLQEAADRMRAVAIETWRINRLREFAYSSFAQGMDGSRWGEVWRAMQAQDEALQAAGFAALRKGAALQREAFDAVVEVLSDTARKVVRSAYLREAYFSAAGVNEDAAIALSRACALGDLTEAQRGLLSSARSEYFDERDTAVALMIEHMKVSPRAAASADAAQGVDAGGGVDERQQHWVQQRTQLEQIQRYAFARDAARDKLLSRLKNILNEEQMRTSGIK